MTRRLAQNHDTILSYQQSDSASWNLAAGFIPYDSANLGVKTVEKYSSLDETGRPYQLTSLLNPNPDRPNLTYEFLGIRRVWRWTRERMLAAYEAGLVVQTATGKVPRLKRYLDEQRGVPLGDVWTDIDAVNSQARERLGYPTQKPVALLERIISVSSSNEEDVVLDPFCGCGTTIHAAQKLHRPWTGIDITHLAISLIEKRLKDAFPGIVFDVHGIPKDLGGAYALAAADKYQFQWWAVSLVNAIPYGGKKKGADSGIDGLIYFKPDGKTTEKAIVSVKGGDNINAAMVRDLAHVVDREKAKIGVLITLNEPTKPMRTEAVTAGFYETYYGKYAKIQILTIEELFAGKKPHIPLVDPTVFPKAAVEADATQGTLFESPPNGGRRERHIA